MLSAQHAAALLGVTERSGRTALASLAGRGILTPTADVRPARTGRGRNSCPATELLHLRASWSSTMWRRG